MRQLFTTAFPEHYRQPEKEVEGILNNTNAPYFEIEDSEGNLEICTQYGEGTARFNNHNMLNFEIFNYEAYINGFSPRFQQHRKRCDLIMASKTDGYFILGEIKNRKPGHDVEERAQEQLSGSLGTIYQVPEIQSYIESKAVKRCCYFNKKAKKVEGINASEAFNRMNEIPDDGWEMSNSAISSYGFKYYEFYDKQTMSLTN